MLVPLHPIAGLICRYGPLPESPAGQPTGPAAVPGALYRQTRLGQSDSDPLASTIDRVSLSPPAGPSGCPADFGSASIIAFSYSNQADADLWWFTSGCQSLDNGQIGAFEVGNPAFYSVFEPAAEALSPSHP